MRKTVSGVTGALLVASRMPAAFIQTSSPSTMIPITAPGMRSANVLNSFSISGNAAASFCLRFGSANVAGGTVPVATRCCACATEERVRTARRTKLTKSFILVPSKDFLVHVLTVRFCRHQSFVHKLRHALVAIPFAGTKNYIQFVSQFVIAHAENHPRFHRCKVHSPSL